MGAFTLLRVRARLTVDGKEENFMQKINETRRIELQRIMQRAVVFVISGVVRLLPRPTHPFC